MGSSVARRSADRRADTARVRRMFWLSFLVLFVTTAAWSLASPLASGPDENAHMVKAAAVVRGELLESSSDGACTGVVDVPYLYAALMNAPDCYAFHEDRPADCSGALPTGAQAAKAAQAPTWVVRNNPLYYWVVGLPSLLPAGPAAPYLMRLVSAALASLVLAWGFRAVAEVSRSSMPVLGLLTAITPMAIFLNSVVNPSGLEISAALALWVCLLALVRDPRPELLTVRAAGVAVVSLVYVNARGLSPLYVAVTVVLVALVGPWRSFWGVVTDRRTWPWLGLVAVGTAAALAWTMHAGTLAAGGASHPELTFLNTAKRTFVQTSDYLTVAIGRFGWMDTSMPSVAYLGFAALIGLPILLVLASARRRDVLALLVVGGTAVMLPVLVQAWQARNVGFIWTARYSMPLYVGVTATAGFIGRDTLAGMASTLRRRLTTIVAIGVAMGTVFAFLINLRRYTVGDLGSWSRIFDGPWRPPVSGALLLLIEIAALAIGVVLLVRHSGGADQDTLALATAPRLEPTAGSTVAERMVDAGASDVRPAPTLPAGPAEP